MRRSGTLPGILALLLVLGMCGCQGTNLSRSKAATLITTYLQENPHTSEVAFHQCETAGKLYPELVRVAAFFSSGCYAASEGMRSRLPREAYSALQEAGLIRGLVVVEPTERYAPDFYHRIIIPSTHVGQLVGPVKSMLVLVWGETAYFLLSDKAAPYVHKGTPNSTSVKIVHAHVQNVEVTGITLKDKVNAEVEATVEYELTPFGRVLSPDFKVRREMRFVLTLYDDGWRVKGP